MESLAVRPARPGDAAELARNWIDGVRHYVELDADAFQVPPTEGLVAWFEELLQRPPSEDAVWLVAEVDGRVVGDVVARLERPAEDAAQQVLRDLGRVRLSCRRARVEAAYRRREWALSYRDASRRARVGCSAVAALDPRRNRYRQR